MKDTKRLDMMRGLFKGKFKKSSVELIRELRKEWDEKLDLRLKSRRNNSEKT